MHCGSIDLRCLPDRACRRQLNRDAWFPHQYAAADISLAGSPHSQTHTHTHTHTHAHTHTTQTQRTCQVRWQVCVCVRDNWSRSRKRQRPFFGWTCRQKSWVLFFSICSCSVRSLPQRCWVGKGSLPPPNASNREKPSPYSQGTLSGWDRKGPKNYSKCSNVPVSPHWNPGPQTIKPFKASIYTVGFKGLKAPETKWFLYYS